MDLTIFIKVEGDLIGKLDLETGSSPLIHVPRNILFDLKEHGRPRATSAPADLTEPGSGGTALDLRQDEGYFLQSYRVAIET